ncbi:hypothetical protein WJX73_010178 [Symbiochloris irregularis]|uniref:Uncharacterized protein n=1 Tax=Symbiochloris irregularis TaxID=706552 RepID=A0AAW1NYM4_9CHLO
MTSIGCQFPLFRERFFTKAKAWVEPEDSEAPAPQGARAEHSGSTEKLIKGRRSADGVASPTLRMPALSLHCTMRGEAPARPSPREWVAASRETLRAAGITHVINCIGHIFHNPFPEELTYLTLCLNDAIGEDLASLFYLVFDFIEGAHKQGGRVLLHCSQGVSRSAALAVAHHMWRTGMPYDEATNAVKAQRGVVNPNIGFMCQLLNWQTDRQQGHQKTQLYSVVPHSKIHGALLVLRAPNKQMQTALLDPRGAFVLQTPDTLFLWKGRKAAASLVVGALAGIAQLQRYEQASTDVQEVQDGEEPHAFEQALQAFIIRPSDASKGLPRYGECPWLLAQYQVHETMLATPPGYTFISIPGRNNAPRAESSSAESSRALKSSGRVFDSWEDRYSGPDSARVDVNRMDSHRTASTLSSSALSSAREGTETDRTTPPDTARMEGGDTSRTTPLASSRGAKSARDEGPSHLQGGGSETSPNSRSRKIPRSHEGSDCCLTDRDLKSGGEECSSVCMDDDMETPRDSEPKTRRAPDVAVPPMRLSGLSSLGGSSRPVPPLALNLALKSRGIGK